MWYEQVVDNEEEQPKDTKNERKQSLPVIPRKLDTTLWEVVVSNGVGCRSDHLPKSCLEGMPLQIQGRETLQSSQSCELLTSTIREYGREKEMRRLEGMPEHRTED